MAALAAPLTASDSGRRSLRTLAGAWAEDLDLGPAPVGEGQAEGSRRVAAPRRAGYAVAVSDSRSSAAASTSANNDGSRVEPLITSSGDPWASRRPLRIPK